MAPAPRPHGSLRSLNRPCALGARRVRGPSQSMPEELRTLTANLITGSGQQMEPCRGPLVECSRSVLHACAWKGRHDAEDVHVTRSLAARAETSKGGERALAMAFPV